MYKKYKNYRNFKIGRRYEGYIAWMLERDGWHVTRRGHYGVHDSGIDLIASKGSRVRYIQCKGWSTKKTIHLDTVTQFHGSVLAMHGSNDVEMYIYTPTLPDDYTKSKADDLNVKFEQVSFPKWMWSWKVRKVHSTQQQMS